MSEVDVWEAAFDQLQAAKLHLKTMLGQPGEAAAKKDHEDALTAYDEASRSLPDA